MLNVYYFKLNKLSNSNRLKKALCDEFTLYEAPASTKSCTFLRNDNILIAMRKKMIDVIILDSNMPFSSKYCLQRFIYKNIE